MTTDSTPSSSEWEPPSPSEIQESLPQLQVVSLLGRGAMGAVYRARQVKLDRDVAIKLLPRDLAAGKESLNFAARFEQEARALADLSHPSIVAIHEFGQTDGGQLYFVMEFVEGMNIDQYRRQLGGTIPGETALAIISQVLAGLEYAHGRGIIHRDIKPANILIDGAGTVKIADFGLAKKLVAPDGGDSPLLTRTEITVGTPDFIAPESLEAGRTVDHRADLYATGIMLYHLLTGKLPRGRFPLPGELLPGLDPRVDVLIERAIESEPDARYQSATAMRKDVNDILRNADADPAHPPGKAKHPATVALGVLLPVFMLGAGGFLFFRGNGGVGPESPSGSTAEFMVSQTPSMEQQVDTPAGTNPPVRAEDTLQPGIESIPPAPAPRKASPSAPAEPPVPELGVENVAKRDGETDPVAGAEEHPEGTASPPPVEEATETTGNAAEPAESVSTLAILRKEGPNAVEWALAPLSQSIPPGIGRNLTLLREDILDEASSNPQAEERTYQLAAAYCDKILIAFEKRNTARVNAGYRAAQANADRKVSNAQLDARRNYQMSWPQYRREADQRKAFDGQEQRRADLKVERVKVDWARLAAQMRTILNADYREFRAALR